MTSKNLNDYNPNLLHKQGKDIRKKVNFLRKIAQKDKVNSDFYILVADLIGSKIAEY